MQSTGPRRIGPTRKLVALPIAFASLLGVLWLFPGAANACVSMKHVKALKGNADIRFSDSASGEDQSSGGVATVSVARFDYQLSPVRKR
jgi:hypothetical protein